MAVFEHTYGPYEGQLTPQWSRFLVIPRHAYRRVFNSKLFTGFFALAFVCPLVMAVIIYLHHNINALAAYGNSGGKHCADKQRVFQGLHDDPEHVRVSY